MFLSPDLNPIEHAFHLLKTPKLEVAAVKACKSISSEETQHMVMSMGSRLQAVIDCKGFASKY